MAVPTTGGTTGSPYATVEQVKAYMGLSDDIDDVQLEQALMSVSREIEDICGRHFNYDDEASTRLFEPASQGVVFVDDFWSLDDLVFTVSTANWTTDYYRLYPLNGIVRGQAWPYTRIEAVPDYGRYPTTGELVSLTAKWGWPAVPEPVRVACMIATAETFALKDARFGVAGFGQYGDLRVKANPMVLSKLRPYMLNPVTVS